MLSQPHDEVAWRLANDFEAAVVPRYAQFFGDMLLRNMQLQEGADLLDLCCRTGYPTSALLPNLRRGRIVALDSDDSFLSVAREHLGEEVGRRVFLARSQGDHLAFADRTFTHVLGNLIDRSTSDRGALLLECARVLRSSGQLLLTMPLRGSFQEVIDMLFEVALKWDLGALRERVEQYERSLPTAQEWQEEAEAMGFEHVGLEEQAFTIGFESGDALFADPVVYAAALPEWQWCADAGPAVEILGRVRDAIDTYFRGIPFELTVVAGCLSAWQMRE